MHGIGTIFIPPHVAKATAALKEAKLGEHFSNQDLNSSISSDTKITGKSNKIKLVQEDEKEAILIHGSKLAIAKENMLVCLHEELVPGLQLEFHGPLSGISATPFSINTSCRVVILKHIPPATESSMSATNNSLHVEIMKHNWIFKVRFQEDVWPKDRDIDLEIYSDFILLRHLPLIYDLSIFQLPSSCKRIDDFRLNLPPIHSPSSTIISKKSKGISSSTDLMMKFPTRSYTERLRNVFEARAAGIGAAAEEEERERLKQIQKEQWAKLIEDRRVAFEEARKKKIEEEQEQLMAEALKAQKHMAKQKQEEDRAFLDATQKAVEEELLSLSSQSSAIRSKS
mmetsp:Transcript_25564/g.35156  ORF Transcript_25564/g.35156 Transcript_25564/m.35156 type:complete len:341 (+) Transcript_25564:526-1548(+)